MNALGRSVISPPIGAIRLSGSAVTATHLRATMSGVEKAEDEPQVPMSGHLATFRSWHGQASFWREVYVRSVATLCAAGVVYVVAALAGLVDTRPLTVVGIVVVGATTPPLIYWWADMVVHWKDLRMSRDWSHTPARNDAERRIRGVYTRALPVELVWAIGVLLIVVPLVS